MELENLKDLKELLNQVPEEVLVRFGIANTEDGLCLAYIQDTDLDAEVSSGNMDEMYAVLTNKHQELKLVAAWLDTALNIVRTDTEDEVDIHSASTEQTCRVCKCTQTDCGQCIEKTGKPCDWVEEDLCSACQGAK